MSYIHNNMDNLSEDEQEIRSIMIDLDLNRVEALEHIRYNLRVEAKERVLSYDRWWQIE